MRNCGNRPSGFTIVELLVAAVITVLLSGILISVITGALTLFNRTQSSLSTNVQAKLIFDLIKRDFNAAIYRENNETLLAADIINSSAQLRNHGWRTTSAVMKPSTPDSLLPLGDTHLRSNQDIILARFGVSGVWLRFVTTNVETSGSLPIVVSYQIARRPVAGRITGDNQAPIRYTLFRSAVSADSTFFEGYTVTAGGYDSSSVKPRLSRNPATVTNPAKSDALADNVVDFGVWLYARDARGNLERLYPTASGGIYRALGQASATGSNRYPEVMDVTVRLLRNDAVEIIENMESGLITRPSGFSSDAAWWWAVVEAHSDVFVQRIQRENG